MHKFIKLFTNKKLLQEAIKIGNEWYIPPSDMPLQDIGHPFIFGATLGFQRGPRFVPSNHLLEILGKYAKKKIIVREKAAWLLICGRDIMLPSIVKEEGNPQNGDHIVFLNEQGEALGIGIKEKKMIRRDFDIGELIRREHKPKRRYS